MNSRERGIAKIHGEHRLREENTWDVFNCAACKDIGFGKRYICGCSNGRFQFHKVCIDHNVSHPFYEGCKFEYKNSNSQLKGIRNCAACGRHFEGERYKVYDKKGKPIAELHPSCMMMTMTPSLPVANLLNNHTDNDVRNVNLVLKEKLPRSSSCILCTRDDVGKKETWAYVDSECESYGCHVICLKDLIKNKFENNRTQLPVCTVGSTPTVNMNELFGPAVPVICPRKLRGATEGTGRTRAIKIAKALLSFMVAAIFGDPVSMTVSAFPLAVALFKAFSPLIR